MDEYLNEEQTVEAETTADAEMDAAWETADQPSAAMPPYGWSVPPAGADQPSEQEYAEQEPDEVEAAPDQAAVQDREELELKYMGETRRVAREEAVALAQKGMDYDRIRLERDELREYRGAALPALELVERLARQSGMSTDAYLDYCQQEMPDAQQGGDWRESTRKDARKRDMRDFISDFPDVKPESIPTEVWSAVAGGRSLTTAYSAHRIRELEAALGAREQQGRNRERAMGSMLESASGDGGDLISKWWREA